MVGSRGPTRGDAKCEKEARRDQWLVASVFMEHDEAGQDSASVKVECSGPFRNNDVVGTSNRENPTAFDHHRLIRPGGHAGPINDANVSQSDLFAIAKEGDGVGECAWCLRGSRGTS
jgi:hypothetical protein